MHQGLVMMRNLLHKDRTKGPYEISVLHYCCVLCLCPADVRNGQGQQRTADEIAGTMSGAKQIKGTKHELECKHCLSAEKQSK